MRVQVIAPDDGWILQRYCEELIRYNGYTWSRWTPTLTQEWDISYFINYALYAPVPNSRLVSGYFTHKEKAHNFDQIAGLMDFCICMSEKYIDVLKKSSEKVFCISPGVNLEFFKPKIILGVVGRLEHDRKGAEIIDRLLKEIPFIEIKKTGHNIPYKEMGKFYNSIDYIFIPSKIEGGPMSLIEAFACGKEVIAPNVGMVGEFPGNIHQYDRADFNSLTAVLDILYEKRTRIRKTVDQYGWRTFAEKHHELFLSQSNE